MLCHNSDPEEGDGINFDLQENVWSSSLSLLTSSYIGLHRNIISKDPTERLARYSNRFQQLPEMGFFGPQVYKNSNLHKIIVTSLSEVPLYK